jgi:hypothetical protein
MSNLCAMTNARDKKKCRKMDYLLLFTLRLLVISSIYSSTKEEERKKYNENS